MNLYPELCEIPCRLFIELGASLPELVLSLTQQFDLSAFNLVKPCRQVLRYRDLLVFHFYVLLPFGLIVLIYRNFTITYRSCMSIVKRIFFNNIFLKINIFIYHQELYRVSNLIGTAKKAAPGRNVFRQEPLRANRIQPMKKVLLRTGRIAVFGLVMLASIHVRMPFS